MFRSLALHVMTPETISHYRLLQRLGAGGMGEVYLAEDLTLSRRVAIKFLTAERLESEDARRRLLREAKAAASLDHPNICPVFEVDSDAGRQFIVMQYVEGETLATTLERGPLPVADALSVCGQVADALAAAHDAGVIHRDIKPQNIIVTRRGVAKVLDFGLAKMLPTDVGDLETATGEAALTLAGTLVGTAPYMAPEQVRLEPSDGRTDLFALGAVLYECVTGRRAFTGKSWPEVCGQVLHVDPPAPSSVRPGLPPEVDDLCRTLLAKDPGQRPASAAILAARLRASAGGDSESLARSSPAGTLAGARRAIGRLTGRTSTRVAGVAGALLATVGLYLGFIASSDRTPAPPPEARRWFDVGTGALREGAYLTASRALEEALTLHDPFPLAHARLAEAQAQLDEMSLALASLLHATTNLPDRSRLNPVEALSLDGITGMVSRDFDAAISAYDRLSTRLPERADIRFDLGQAYEADDRPEEALESYAAAIAKDALFAPAFLRQGILLGRRRELDPALESLRRAESLFQSSGNFEGVAMVVYQRGVLFNRLERATEAQAELERALQLATATDNPYVRLQALARLSGVVSARGEFREGERYATEALELSRGRGSLAASALIDLGNVFFLEGDLDRAATRFDEALRLADRVGAARTKARAEASLASLTLKQERMDATVRHAEAALAYYRQGQYRREVSQVTTILGYVHSQRGELDLARRAFEEQLRLGTELGDASEMARAGLALAETLVRQGRHPDALRRVDVAIDRSAALGNQVNVAYGRVLRADALWRVNRIDEARAELDAIAADPSLVDVLPQIQPQLDLTAARIALCLRDPRTAVTLARRSLAAAQRTEREAIEAAVIVGLASTLAGERRTSVTDLARTVTRATDLGDAFLETVTTLGLAEAQLAAGRSRESLETATEAYDRAGALGQLTFAWRAASVGALAAQAAGDADEQRRLLDAAGDRERRLRAAWKDDEAVGQFFARPDIDHLRLRLAGAGLASATTIG